MCIACAYLHECLSELWVMTFVSLSAESLFFFAPIKNYMMFVAIR